MTRGAGILKDLLGRCIPAACSSPTLALLCRLGRPKVLDEIVDQDRKILRIDLSAVRNHGRHETFPAVFVEVKFDYTVQSMAGGAGGLKNFLSVTVRKLWVLYCCKCHRRKCESSPKP